MYKTVFKACQ